MFVTVTLDLPHHGTVEVSARVVLGRPAPLAVDEASYADPGDGSSIDLLGVLGSDADEAPVAFLTPRTRHCDFTDEDMTTCERAALEEAASWAR